LPEATSLWITYSEGESNSGKESSRFVKQIEYEWSKENPNIQLRKQNFQLPFSMVKQSQGAFPQTQSTQNAIKNYFAEGVSASSLNKFLICPQDFYYKHIIGLHEEENVEEELESSSFGSFVHRVLEILFQPFLGRQVLVTDIDKMLLTYTAILEEQFLKQFNNDKNAFRTGNNQLSFQIASYQLERYLHFERNNLLENPDKKLIINKLEHKFLHELHLDFNGERIPLNIKGYADRIDSWGDEIRIIDYKTGKCEAKHLKYCITEENLADFAQIREALNKSKFTLQLSMYAYLYFQQFKYYPDNCSILSFTHLDSGYQVLEKQNYAWKEVVEKTEQAVQQIASNILQIEQFSHDESAQYCSYCEVKKRF
jgi:ATP-dependent exoDNAse (exonuclease V) beta subunit